MVKLRRKKCGEAKIRPFKGRPEPSKKPIRLVLSDRSVSFLVDSSIKTNPTVSSYNKSDRIIRLARTAQTNLESLLLERLLLHLCVLARAHRRKGSLPRLCGERVLLRVIDTLWPIGFGVPTRPLFSTPNEVFAGNTHFYRPNTCENLYKWFVRNPPGGSHRGKSWFFSVSVLSSLSYALCALLW